MMKILVAVVISAVLSTVSAKHLRFVQLRSEYSPANYVTAYWPDGSVRVDSVSYLHASTFELHTLQQNTQWQLRAMKNNMFLTAENGGGGNCIADRESASGWETFNVTYLSNNRVQLQSFSGRWVGMDPSSSSLVASASFPGSAETFFMEEIAQQRAVNIGAWMVPEKWMSSQDSALWKGVSAGDLHG